MKKSLRDFLADLDQAGELRMIENTVDVRDVSALVSQSKRALMCNSLKDYPGWRLCGGLLSTRKRLALAMGGSENEVAMRFEEGLGRALDPLIVSDAPCQEVVRLGSEVDLTAIPFPMMHVLDGGPYISATMVTSKDPEFGRNVGSYRLMYRTPTETGIDLRFTVGYALLLSTRARQRTAARHCDRNWRASLRNARGFVQGADRFRTNMPLPADCTASRYLWSSARQWTSKFPPMPKLCWKEKSSRLGGPPMKVRLGNSVKFPETSNGTQYFELSVSLIARTRSFIYCRCPGKTIGYARL